MELKLNNSTKIKLLRYFIMKSFKTSLSIFKQKLKSTFKTKKHNRHHKRSKHRRTKRRFRKGG